MSDDWTRDLPTYLRRSLLRVNESAILALAKSAHFAALGDVKRAEVFARIGTSMARSLDTARQTIAAHGPDTYPRLAFEIERIRWLNEGLTTNN